MGNYLSLFLRKGRRWIILFFLAGSLTGGFYLAVHRVVNDFIPGYAALTADRLKLTVSFARVSYSFPRSIVIDNVKIFDQRAASAPMLEIPRLKLVFELPFYSSRAGVRLKTVVLSRMKIRVPLLGHYLTHGGGPMFSEFRALPSGDIHVYMPQAQLYLSRDSRVAAPIVFDADASMDQGQFAGKFKDSDLFFQVWGRSQGERVNWKGYAFYEGPLAPEPVYVLDMNGAFQAGKQDILLKKLSFTVNGDDYLVWARYPLNGDPEFETKVLYARRAGGSGTQAPLKKIGFDLKGNLAGGTVEGKGSLEAEFLSDPSWKKVRLTFEGLRARIINDRLLQVKTGQARLAVIGSRHEYQADLQDFISVMTRPGPEQFLMTLSARSCGGRLQERLLVNTAALPWQAEVHGRFDDVDIRQLGWLRADLAKYSGQLSGVFDMRAAKDLSISGTLSMRGGNFSDLGFMPWPVAKVFQMPSLDHLSKVGLMFHFKYGQDSMAFNDILLRSDLLNLKGSFRESADGLVASRMAVFFPRRLLEESPVGQKVIKLVPAAWALPFEFRLSGYAQRMNFQWADSVLKRRIDQRLPGFVERIIQRQIDKKTSEAAK